MSIRNLAKTHEDVLEALADALDIPPSLYDAAVNRYKSVGAWLDRSQSTIAKYKPEISPQGSFLLGTITRPLTDRAEYDVDLVCRLNALKSEFTQETLKQSVGREVQLYADAHSMHNPVTEKRRCWTLYYADGAQFHMDILPALPDAQTYQLNLENHGFGYLASNPDLSGEAIAITDNTAPEYSHPTNDWPQSNPIGYAAWFRTRMIAQLLERKELYIREQQMISASVEDIPDYRTKTPLQRAIQLLKRHRDMFSQDSDNKPISIIITTLAGHAYNEESTISAALRSILRDMDKHIEYRGDEAWIANPVNPVENFADKWINEPKKRDCFYEWLEKARNDFGLYISGSPFYKLPEVLREGLGAGLVDRTLEGIQPGVTIAVSAPAIVNSASGKPEVERAQSAVNEFKSAGIQQKPWTKK